MVKVGCLTSGGITTEWGRRTRTFFLLLKFLRSHSVKCIVLLSLAYFSSKERYSKLCKIATSDYYATTELWDNKILFVQLEQRAL